MNRIARLLSTGHGARCSCRRPEEVPSDNVAPGKVMQDPTPGSKADKGSAISVVCSCGEPQKGSTSPQKENTAPQQKDVAPSQQKGVSPSP